MLSFGRELLVLCLHTGSDTLLEGASGGEPARDAVQRAACSGLALPRAAEGPVCPVLHLAGALVRSSLPCHSRSEG